MNRFEFALLGPSSSFKTRTAHDIASALGDDAVVISKGSFYRTAAELLDNSPVNSNSPFSEIHEILSPMKYTIVNNNIVKGDIDGSGIHHTHENGNHASDYSQNPVIQEVLENFFKKTKQSLIESGYFYIGTEGRSMAPEGGLSIYVTAPIATRAEIKRIECPEEVYKFTDDEIMEEIKKRDVADFRNPHSVFRKPYKGIVVRRFDASDDTHAQIVKDVSSAIRQIVFDREALPHRQILWEYGRPTSRPQNT